MKSFTSFSGGPFAARRGQRSALLCTLILSLGTAGCAGTMLREIVAPPKIEWQDPVAISQAKLEGREAGAIATRTVTPGEKPPIEKLIRSIEAEGAGEQTDAPKVHASSIEKEDAPTSLWDRIRAGFAMPQLNTRLVARKERQYLSQPEYMQRMMKRGSRYLFHIVEEIERRGMPTEIALLPFVESAMNPVAMSHAKASGLWQFIPSTGRAYDLKQNWWADNRRDVVQSTRAALDYLQMLHKMHNGDWFLALASYNWGEGSVNRAIRNNRNRGRGTDYLSLRMPNETRHYVPKLLALKNILNNADSYGLALPDLPNEPYFAVLEKTRPIDLDLAARFAGMPVKEFVALNPSHNRPVIYASSENMFKIPTANLDRFLAAMEDHEEAGKPFVTWRPYTLRKGETVASVARRSRISESALLKANGLSAKRRIIAGTRLLVPSKKARGSHLAKFAGPRVVEVIKRPAAYHRVKRRDTLTRIARRWGVSTRSLKRWNGLRSNRVRKGQRLLVRQPKHQTVETTALGKRKIIARHAAPTLRATSSSAHKVSGGQTLGAIARRYGVSIAQLRAWNGISGDRIRIGQRLIVRPRQVAKVSPKTRATSRTASRYRVKAGDNLTRIAKRHEMTVARLRSLNNMRGSRIRPGQTLLVAAKSAAAKSTPTRTTRNKTQGARVIKVAANGASNHRVRRGDTLIAIARRYGLSVNQVRKLNGLRGSGIRAGQTLRVAGTVASRSTRRNKPATIRHRVRSGDTLIGIAKRYGVSVTELRQWNALKGDRIRRGQKLTIEAVESAQLSIGSTAQRGG